MKKKENEIQELEKLAEVLRNIGLDAKVDRLTSLNTTSLTLEIGNIKD